MAEVLPLNFPIPSESALANYDFTDLASGLGFVKYYGAVEDSAGYILLTEPLYSPVTYTQRSGAGTTTVNFDTSTFNLPRTAKGTAIFSCARFYTTTESKQVKVTIQKVDASNNVTTVGAQVSSGDTTVNARMVLLKVPLTQTIIKKGEKLRLKVDLVVDTGTGVHEIGHDPKNQNGSSLNLTIYPTVTTVMTLLMPFRVDL